MRKLVTVVVTLLALSFVFAGCSSSGSEGNINQGAQENTGQGSTETVKWIANSAYPEDNHIGETLKNFAAKVNEKTNGAVEIEVMAGGALGYEGPELLKVVRDGIVPVSDMLMSGVAGEEPLYGIGTLPFLYRNLEEAKILTETARPYYDKVAEEKWNQKILYIAPWPLNGFWTQKELTSLEDLKGLKMRTFDEMGAHVVDAFGGTPYPLPFSEVYSSLATGVIDSVVTSTVTAVDAKFWEVLDYFSPVAVFMGSNAVAVNLDEFNKLDEATQEAIIEAGKEAEAEIWARVAELDKEMEAIVNENGITTVQPSEELINELNEITEGIRQNWLDKAPAEAQEIIEKYFEAVGR